MTSRRLFLIGLGSAAVSALVNRAAILAASPTGRTPAKDVDVSPAACSIEESRRLMCLEIRTDPNVALDTVIFVDQWKRELGRIVDLGIVSPFARGAGVGRRERPPPGSGARRRPGAGPD